MYIPKLLSLAAGVFGPSQQTLGPHANARETLEDAVISAANLAKTVTTGTLASVFPAGSPNAGLPYALMESHAPCHPDGGLTFITMPLSLNTRNIRATSGQATYALQTPLKKGVSEYAQPRVSFIGNMTIFEEISKEEDARLRECYVKYHPDAKWWLPGDPRGAHVSHWGRLDPTDIYYIGGFGTTGWIGHIPVDKFADAMGPL